MPVSPFTSPGPGISLTDLALLVVAGFGAGLIGYITGLASVVSYPALLAVGLSPVAANVTNTVALVAVGVGSTAQSGRLLLEGDRRRLIGGALASLVGGVIGAVTLLITPSGAFEAIVPVLVTVAALALLAQPLLRRWATGYEHRPWVFLTGVTAIGVYGGYFGAGAGIMMLALLLVVTSGPLWRAVLSKSLYLGLANGVAAIGFVIFGPVDPWAAAAMAVGCLVGGWCGPPVVKRLPAGPLRVAVGLGGLGLALWLALR